jgi:hypothetical protein
MRTQRCGLFSFQLSVWLTHPSRYSGVGPLNLSRWSVTSRCPNHQMRNWGDYMLLTAKTILYVTSNDGTTEMSLLAFLFGTRFASQN